MYRILLLEDVYQRRMEVEGRIDDPIMIYSEFRILLLEDGYQRMEGEDQCFCNDISCIHEPVTKGCIPEDGREAEYS